MERRKAIGLSLAAVTAGGLGTLALTTAFKPKMQPGAGQQLLEFSENETAWKYHVLDPAKTAELAYREYPNGSCMYGVFSSVMLQLSEIVGEPFCSFPLHMMKYGHGGVNGAGSICGALNGAAALIGLLVAGKKQQDALAAQLFHSYETTPMPVFVPDQPAMAYTPPTSVAGSVLCHASTTRWGKVADLRIDSKERKERCRRLTADIARLTVSILNNYHSDAFFTGQSDDKTVSTCMSCHGSQGKLANTSGKMHCTSCHSESAGHRLFGDLHYKLMKER